MRIVLDSNVLVRAAWKPDGLANQLLRIIVGGPHVLIASPFILSEVARVLAYPRIQLRWPLSTEQIQEHVNRIAAIAEIVSRLSAERVVPADADDDLVVQTAISGKADILCTRDAHLHAPEVVEYCMRRAIRIVDDLQLYRILHG